MTGNFSACRILAAQHLERFTGFLTLLLISLHTVARADEPVDIRPAQRASAGNSSDLNSEKSFLVEWKDVRRNRIVPARIYVPPKGDHWPIIIFSHGLGGTRNGYSHYGNHWSQSGFFCVHLEHEGSDGDVLQKGAGLQNMKKLQAAAADPRNALNRAKDVTFAIDQIIAAHQHGGEGDLDSLKGKLNTERIGMAGSEA
jgi:predicted dienelactone hydrolase